MAKKHFTRAICALLCLMMLPLSLAANAALFAFETQYDYDSAEPAWLTDLVVKEDMTTIAGMAERLTLIAKPSYPYTETPESFSKDVSYYCSLYNLEEGTQRAALIYLFELAGSQSGLLAADTSDEDIRAYIEGLGIKYPDSVGADELIAARALYMAMVTGTFSRFTGGATLEETLVAFAASLTGMNVEQLKSWMPEASILSLDEYLLASSRLALWTNGYDVTPETEENTVFRLIAVMTIEKMGISANSDLSFDELKLKYLSAMLAEKYGVTADDERLKAAIESNSVDFYILQLIGKKSGLSVRADNSTYQEAFEFVAKNTGAFNIEDGEFYADIMDYDVYLKYKRGSLWFYPTAYTTGNNDYIVSIDVNGQAIKNNYYTQVPINADAAQQTLKITVVCNSSSKSSKCVYNIVVHQGEEEYSVQPEETQTLTPEQGTFESSESIVSGILSSLGLNTSISSIIDKVYTSLPGRFKQTVSFIAPTFGGTSGDSALLPSGGEDSGDAKYIERLDKIGALFDVDVQGIYGIQLLGDTAQFSLEDYITFE